MDVIEKKQHKQAATIKQKCNREQSKRMWYLIKRTVKDPQNGIVLKEQRVVDGEEKEYEVQEDVENAIQRECKVRFLLVHITPIMNTLLGE